MAVLRPATGAASTTRQVGIPSSIRHVALLQNDETDNLSTKLSLAKEEWVRGKDSYNRGILFVPNPDDVENALGILKFWGVGEAKNLQKSLGIYNPRYVVKGDGDEDEEEEEDEDEEEEETEAEVVSKSNSKSSTNSKESKTEKYLKSALQSNIGAASSGNELQPPPTTTTTTETIATTKEGELFVVPVSGSRGLHLQNIDCVLVLKPPKVMDEYLHMAGRTGRLAGVGLTAKAGTVVTVVTYDELKRLKSWETPLGIQFDVVYQRA
jgi:hypothetical protein